MKKIKLILKNYPALSLTTIAQRIPDMWILSLFNHLSIPTSIVQHGLWSDKLQRVAFFSLITQKFSKFIYYLSTQKKYLNLIKFLFFYTLKDLYDFLLKENKTIPETNYLDNDMIRSKKVFSFDKSWDDYYVMKYGYNIKNLIYIGNPDLMLLKEIDINKQENSVCYICQSLVEDGRLEKNIYQDFLKN